MATSSIEWTEETWNPVTGCTRASAGCDLCYAVTMTRRLEAMGSPKYQGLINPGKGHFNGLVLEHADSLSQPLKRTKGTLYFVNSMSDLFHPGVSFEFTAAVFGAMAMSPQHRFQVLTKRPDRAAQFFAWLDNTSKDRQVEYVTFQAHRLNREVPFEQSAVSWPLENVWIGTSIEDDRVSHRIDELRQVTAAGRFLSCEPLIGGIDLTGKLDGIHWVIVGGESGAGARPMRFEWAEAIQTACNEAGVAFFFKQTGRVLAAEWGLGSTKGSKAEDWPAEYRAIDQREFPRGMAAV